MILDSIHNPLTFASGSEEELGNNTVAGMDTGMCDSFFDSFLDTSMLLPSNDGLLHLDEGAVQSLATPGTKRSSTAATAATRPGSLYDRLKTGPASPFLSPYMGSMAAVSPQSINMAMAQDQSWMHSNRPRRRRSNYASPTLGAWNLSTQPLTNPYGPMMAPPPQYAMGFNPYGMPLASPTMADPWGAAAPPGAAFFYPQTAPMLAVPRTPKFPMAPQHHHASPSGHGAAGLGTKMPLVLPLHLQQPVNSSLRNAVAPNSSEASGRATPLAIAPASGIPSRCSSIAPSSSASCIGSAASLASQHRSWFTEMNATKDLFLREVERIDFANVTVLELKNILRKFGLNASGKKAQLTDRVKEIVSYLRSSEKGQK